MPLPIYQVDSFSSACFRGNPAAVCVLAEPTSDAAWMQSLAGEMNLSETAFVEPIQSDGCFPLRWFTPLAEVDLCGHATLAAAHVLWSTGQVTEDNKLQFKTRSGMLTVSRDGSRITMDFPAKLCQSVAAPPDLLESLGLDSLGPAETTVYRNDMDYLVEVKDADTLRKIAPDFARLGKVEARGVIVTCLSDVDEFDFLSRFFAPRVGVNEDPVTGSAHCCLAPFWADRLGRTELTGYQASARGGEVGVVSLGERVLLKGEAVTVFVGSLAPHLHPRSNSPAI